MKKRFGIIVFSLIVISLFLYLLFNTPLKLSPPSPLCPGGSFEAVSVQGVNEVPFDLTSFQFPEEREKARIIARTTAEMESIKACRANLPTPAPDPISVALSAREKCESNSRAISDTQKVICSLGSTSVRNPSFETNCIELAKIIKCTTTCKLSVDYSCNEQIAALVIQKTAGTGE